VPTKNKYWYVLLILLLLLILVGILYVMRRSRNRQWQEQWFTNFKEKQGVAAEVIPPQNSSSTAYINPSYDASEMNGCVSNVGSARTELLPELELAIPKPLPTSSASGARAIAADAARCKRPHPSGGTCKNKADHGGQFCYGLTCSRARCSAGKSSSAATCPAHDPIPVRGGHIEGHVSVNGRSKVNNNTTFRRKTSVQLHGGSVEEVNETQM
jgi:hypothetical protein